MNVQQALQAIVPQLTPDRVLEPGPAPVPAGLYAVVSELPDVDQGAYHAAPSGGVPQRRTLTLLVTLYGEEGSSPADLRPHYERLRHLLPTHLTEHPTLPPLSRVGRGAARSPTLEPSTQRPEAALRVHLTYVE